MKQSYSPNKTRLREPVVPRQKFPPGKVFILVERCKGCQFCVEFCPKQVLTLSPRFNAKGYHYPVVENPDLCVNCQLCYYLCPELAIYVVSNNNNHTIQK